MHWRMVILLFIRMRVLRRYQPSGRNLRIEGFQTFTLLKSWKMMAWHVHTMRIQLLTV